MDSRLRLAHELVNRGWSLLGYNKVVHNEKGYIPECWSGVCTKNGFTLCMGLDKEEQKYYSGATIYKDLEGILAGGLTEENYIRIERLKSMTQLNGCTKNEEDNAKMLISKLYAKDNVAGTDKKVTDTMEYTFPIFQTRLTMSAQWHIEKDGLLYGGGTGFFGFFKIPPYKVFNISTMRFKENYDPSSWFTVDDSPRIYCGGLTEEEFKEINRFKEFISNLERAVSNVNASCVTKTVLKPVKIKRKTPQVGDITLHHNFYYEVTHVFTGLSRVSIVRVDARYSILRGANTEVVSLSEFQATNNYPLYGLWEVEEGVKIW
ncbi:MAG TPA: hypothetical protein VIK26_10970 [Clostridium sp.]